MISEFWYGFRFRNFNSRFPISEFRFRDSDFRMRFRNSNLRFLIAEFWFETFKYWGNWNLASSLPFPYLFPTSVLWRGVFSKILKIETVTFNIIRKDNQLRWYLLPLPTNLSGICNRRCIDYHQNMIFKVLKISYSPTFSEPNSCLPLTYLFLTSFRIASYPKFWVIN